MSKSFLVIISILLIMSQPIYGNNRVVVGGKTFTESHIMTRMLTLLLKKEGYAVDEKINLLTRVIRPKLIKGEIDIYWEYTGTAFRGLLRKKSPEDIKLSTDSEKLYQKVKELDKANGVIWLNKSTLNNAFIIMTDQKTSDQYNLKSLSDLTNLINQNVDFTYAMIQSYVSRPEGFRQMGYHYGFKLPQNIKILAHKQIYQQLKWGLVQVGLGYGTDPQIKEYNLVVLEDDKNFLPFTNPAPVVNEEFYNKNPTVTEIANQLGPLIDHQSIIELNHQVDFQKKTVEEVAKTFLQNKGLL